MSNQNTNVKQEHDQSINLNNNDVQKQQAKQPLQKGVLVILVIMFSLIIWYLVADRFAPYTTQARVQTYVVGVSPKVSGLVDLVHVGNNQQVDSGQLLFEIDSSNYQIALNKALSDLENTKNQVNAGDASVDNAKAKLKSAMAGQLKAEQDLTRLQRLYEDDPGTISVRRIEVSQANLTQARARVSSATAAIKQATEQKGGDDNANNAKIKAAQSAVAKAKLDLKNTKIIAKSPGVITNLSAEQGQFASAGKPVMTLISLKDVWINAEFTENNLGHLQAGSEVEILFDSVPGEIFKGTIRSIGIGVSSGKQAAPGTLPSVDNDRDWLRQSQRFPVVIEFNPKQHPHLLSNLRVGGQASVVAFADSSLVSRWLGEIHIRIMSWLSYAY